MIHAHIDVETFSTCDIRRAGGYQYARHPSTECLMVAYQIEDPDFGPGPVDLWDCSRWGLPLPPDLRDVLDDPGVKLCAFNAAFEMGIFEHCLGVALPPSRWFCVQALAMSYGLPGSLGGVGDALRLGSEHAKKDGDKLIRRFSIPQKDGRRIMPDESPTEWELFKEYCRRDVVAEREIYRRLSK